MARVHPPRSTAEDAFWSPLAILPLRGGGGGPELDAQLSNDRDLINGAQVDSGPPLPFFL
jgi:hypothetical protein